MDDFSNDLLEKIDILRERMNVSYKEAKEALDQASGDLVTAIINLEQETRVKWTEKIQGKGEEMLDRLKIIFEKGTATRVRVKKDDKVLFELPAGAGVLGLVGMLMSGELAVLGAMGTVTALLNKCTLEIEHQGRPPARGEGVAAAENHSPEGTE